MDWDDFNQFEENCNQDIFTVFGRHEVILYSPTVAQITVLCPWPEELIGEPMTLEHQAFVQTQAKAVANYLLDEGFMDRKAPNGVNVKVMTYNTRN